MAIFGRDTAIDLGTAYTRIHVRRVGLVLDEPSLVAVADGQVIAAGIEAQRMIGLAGISIEHPVRHGAIADLELAERMLRLFLRKVHKWRRLAPPCVAVAVPSGSTVVERRAVHDVAYRAGARSVRLVETPVAAALGCGLSLRDAVAVLAVDVGAGSTDVAILSLGGVVVAETVKVGGDDVDHAIATHVQAEHAMLVGELAPEKWTDDGTGGLEINGRWKATGLPGTVTLGAEEVGQAAVEPITAIVTTVRGVLESCPPELSGDLMDRGIALTGGGSLLHGLTDLLRKETRLPVQIADEPFYAVILGTASHLDGVETPRRPQRRKRKPKIAVG
ncbi:rod shape-determining protein [Spirillospora sp. NPDC048911]|uniref:rod shape-determining protein n=1 Tax=Spirillospora sp. NPDC048911 TaxID=3364527 RepID=UPI0037237CB8